MGKSGKRTFKPLDVNYTAVGARAAPALLGQSDASRLAAHLRSRARDQRCPGLQQGAFAPLSSDVSPPCCVNQDQLGPTWAQRARLGSTRALAPKANLASAVVWQEQWALKVRLPDGTPASLSGVLNSSTVDELLQAIEKAHGIRSDHLMLSFFGRALQRGTSLNENGVANGALIHAAFRARVPEDDRAHEPTSALETTPTTVAPCRSQCHGETTSPEIDASAQRQVLVNKVFNLLDRDCDGFLNQAEMNVLARQTGFDGTTEEWTEEYRGLCSEHGLDEALGLDRRLFDQLINDLSDSGIHCNNDELRTMLATLI